MTSARAYTDCRAALPPSCTRERMCASETDGRSGWAWYSRALRRDEVSWSAARCGAMDGARFEVVPSDKARGAISWAAIPCGASPRRPGRSPRKGRSRVSAARRAGFERGGEHVNRPRRERGDCRAPPPGARCGDVSCSTALAGGRHNTGVIELAGTFHMCGEGVLGSAIGMDRCDEDCYAPMSFRWLNTWRWLSRRDASETRARRSPAASVPLLREAANMAPEWHQQVRRRKP